MPEGQQPIKTYTGDEIIFHRNKCYIKENSVAETVCVLVGEVSQLEPELAKLCEAQGRKENVPDRGQQLPKTLRWYCAWPLGSWGAEKGMEEHEVGEVGRG